MNIKIYTYSDPYNIHRESFWNEIKDCPQFCVSQTMVNGLNNNYSHFKNNHQLSTIKKLVNSLYNKWLSRDIMSSQRMEIYNAINSLEINLSDEEKIKRSLEFNSTSLLKCVRLFCELGLNPDKMKMGNLTKEQQLLIQIYKIILNKKNSYFKFKHVTDKQTIDDSIKKAISEDNRDSLNYDTIVIHGIHQFTPAMLCAIEDIYAFKKVILLFNYQEQYKNIYQTWINIYSLFDCEIYTNNENQFQPNSILPSYSSNVLADNIGKLAEGELTINSEPLKDIEIIEFENLTEFVGYTADLYEKAVKNKPKNSMNPELYYMQDQMYSASSKANDVLRAYFPEQFGERHFLDYPIGHFFVAIMNMWDSENEKVKVDDFSNIKDCFLSGVIYEDTYGELVHIFNIIEPFIEKETSLTGILKAIKVIKKYSNTSQKEQKKIGYFKVSKNELEKLYKAINDLNQIIISFFYDFNAGGNNFQRFYNRVFDFVNGKINSNNNEYDSLNNTVSNQEQNEFDEDMRKVISDLIHRLEHINLSETGTFQCLKQTMFDYLSTDKTNSANWIVRNFEQIDGDILRSSKQQNRNICYHFCCLSDKDIFSTNSELLPWPLDINFFEFTYEPLDWKYQIFLKSKMEYKNFKRYALLYGLEFNRVNCKLSYIKTENNQDNDLFYMFAMLGLKVVKYKNEIQNNYLPIIKYIPNETIEQPNFDNNDILRYTQCPYKFALESVVQNDVIFRDRFLILNYLKILIMNQAQESCCNMPNDKSHREILKNKIIDLYNDIGSSFKIFTEFEKTHIISSVYNSIVNNDANKYSFQKPTLKQKKKNIEFLFTKTSEIEQKVETKGITINFLTDTIKKQRKYQIRPGKDCKYCASKDICLLDFMN